MPLLMAKVIGTSPAMSERRGTLAAILFLVGVAIVALFWVSTIRWLRIAVDEVGEDVRRGSEGEKDCSGAHVGDKLGLRRLSSDRQDIRRPECSG
jgi:hypothetical protein